MTQVIGVTSVFTVAFPASLLAAASPLEPAMVTIPAGSYMMGCAGDKQCDSDELPVHAVSLAAYQISQTEITFDQWDFCYKDGVCEYKSDNGWGRGGRPVINTNWYDALQYTQWLSNKTGGKYSLPTEAQWEYASRANTHPLFMTGDCINTLQANFDGSPYQDNSHCELTTGESSSTLPVASFGGNAFDLYDMHGNASEWTLDCYRDTYLNAPADGSAVENTDPQDCASRVVRGGSWYSLMWDLRSTTRASYPPDLESSTIGFRVVKEVPGSATTN